ncbi:MAG: hypothetical protein K2M75_03120 [Clostridia bacterium]|nr:hypothetical protein [Clostridia bacterium]
MIFAQNKAMWWLYLIFAVILVLYCIFVIIAYGIKLVLRLDTDNLSVCLKCYIFDWIEVFCIKFFECEGAFYYQLNKKQLKTVKSKDDSGDNKQKKQKKKLKTGAYISKLWSKSPSIAIRRLSIDYATTFEDVKDKALLDASATVVSNSLIAASSQKLQIKDFEIENISDKTRFSGAELECIIGLTLFKMALFSLYAMAIKKKYEVAA